MHVAVITRATVGWTLSFEHSLRLDTRGDQCFLDLLLYRLLTHHPLIEYLSLGIMEGSDMTKCMGKACYCLPGPF